MRLPWCFACVAIAACGGDGSAGGGSTGTDTGGSTTASADTSTTTTTQSSSTTSASTGTSSEGDTTVVASSESSTSGSTGTDDGSTTALDDGSTSRGSGSSDSGSESGVVMHQACTDGCAIEFMCGDEWTSAQECSDWCEANLVEAAAFAPSCADAWANLSACFATLDCEQFAAYENPQMFPYPCSDEADALAFECKGQ